MQSAFDIQKFMAEARRIQRESGKSFCGRHRLQDTTLSAIRAAALEMFDNAAPISSVKTDHAQQLVQRFEEMCRRRKVPLG
jgi:hypothetical protein